MPTVANSRERKVPGTGDEASLPSAWHLFLSPVLGPGDDVVLQLLVHQLEHLRLAGDAHGNVAIALRVPLGQ